jgi:hypothetical protein
MKNTLFSLSSSQNQNTNKPCHVSIIFFPSSSNTQNDPTSFAHRAGAPTPLALFLHSLASWDRSSLTCGQHGERDIHHAAVDAARPPRPTDQSPQLEHPREAREGAGSQLEDCHSWPATNWQDVSRPSADGEGLL